jgi:conjugal transfer/entry exclusion protein
MYNKEGKTMKKAALEQITGLENIFKQIEQAVESCSGMQSALINQESLESEIVKKVDRQFDGLKTIIDDQKKNAENTIKNLESVLEYKAPPQDLAKETLQML